MSKYIADFNSINLSDLNRVGGKNASLGEMIQNLTKKGIKVPSGFAVTSDAYWAFLDENKIRTKLSEIIQELNTENFSNLNEVSQRSRSIIFDATIPLPIQNEIFNSFRDLIKSDPTIKEFAVRSSATAEDLPTASFAGIQDSFLNVQGEEDLLLYCKQCYASMFSERAIKYRVDQGFGHMNVALSIGIQQMVRSDIGCSGVAFTLEPETGFRDIVVINGIWGLGDNIVQGVVDPDEFVVFKPSLKNKKKSIISAKIGSKAKTLIYCDDLSESPSLTTNTDTPQERREELVLNDGEVETLARWCLDIEEYYKTPMDIEWAKDGNTGKLFIVQARPETVHSSSKSQHLIYNYKLLEKGNPLVSGISLGKKIATGKARILNNPKDADKLQKGEVLVTDITNPDWDPVMKKAAAIVTNKGGRTSHAAIVARELGVVAVVGSGNATDIIKDGQLVTVSCVEGKQGYVYDGELKWSKEEIDISKISMPETEVMLILANPDKAFQYSFLPNNGIGLLRMEFIINNAVQIHPMALVKYDDLEDKEARHKIDHLTKGYLMKGDYFIDKLSQSVATVAAAFYPKNVIVRMSDFKTNEYANLIGGNQFEPNEENPMLGFRGASRYYSPLYKEGFRLECEAMKVVRDEMGLTNVKLMIPFCRTLEEGKKVVELMSQYGLKRGVNGLEIYTMIEVPSNVILGEHFAKIFDGFSIGSNDLTQLTLGIDRDSDLVSTLFDENNDSVKIMISQIIDKAKASGVKIGLCGQAPSDLPEFASFLINKKIDSISFTPDALIAGINNINKAEEKLSNSVLNNS